MWFCPAHVRGSRWAHAPIDDGPHAARHGAAHVRPKGGGGGGGGVGGGEEEKTR
jgi:hypothetical protein